MRDSFAFVDKVDGNGNWPHDVLEMVSLLGSLATGPFLSFRTFCRRAASSCLIKFLDAPESALKKEFVDTGELVFVITEATDRHVGCNKMLFK